MQIKNLRILHFFGINAIVLYPFVLYASKEPEHRVFVHEGIHLQQIKRDGVSRFYFNYLKEYFQLRSKGYPHDQAYRRISYEVEAYSHQHEADYVVTTGSSGKLIG